MHRSCGPAKSTPVAETLAASKAVGETVILKDILSNLLGKKVKPKVRFDYKYLLFGLLFSKSKQNLICNKVNFMRFYFETTIDLLAWISGLHNPAGFETENDNVLAE